jgi:hypothetical protein
MNHNLLRVSSDFRSLPTMSTTNFEVLYGNTQLIQAISRIVFINCDIPNVFYNINDTGYNFQNLGNNRFIYRNSAGGDISVVIPPGQYTIQQVLDIINADIVVNGNYTPSNGIILTLNPLTGKIEYTNTTGFQSFGINDGQVIPAFPWSTMSNYLGFQNGEPWAYTPFVAASNFPNLNGLAEVYLTSQKMSDFSSMVVGYGIVYPVILNVPLDKSFGNYVNYRNYNPELADIEFPSITQGVNLQSIDLQVRDRWGNIVSVGELPINLVAKVYHGHSN